MRPRSQEAAGGDEFPKSNDCPKMKKERRDCQCRSHRQLARRRKNLGLSQRCRLWSVGPEKVRKPGAKSRGEQMARPVMTRTSGRGFAARRKSKACAYAAHRLDARSSRNVSPVSVYGKRE